MDVLMHLVSRRLSAPGAAEWNLDDYHGRHLCLLGYFTSKSLQQGPALFRGSKQAAESGAKQTPSVLVHRSCAFNFLHSQDKHDCFAWHRPPACAPLCAPAVKHCSNLHPRASLMSRLSPGIRSNYCIIRLWMFV